MEASVYKQHEMWCRTQQGFALIIALTMMAFILLLLLSLSTLVQTSTATASVTRELTEARHNALFAMEVAIGELVQYVGPDQRVTARADIDSGATVAQSNWIGVYDATDTTNREPIKWLLSQQNEAQPGEMPVLASGVTLERTSDKPDASNDIQADRIPIQADGFVTGYMAYFVDDEGIKAKVTVDAPETIDSGDPAAFRKELGQAMLPSPEVLAYHFDNDAYDGVYTSKVTMLDQIKDADPSFDVRAFKRSWTTDSYGLLVDVRDGGFKKDLTIAFEEDVIFNQHFSGHDNRLVHPGKRASTPQHYANWSILKDYYNLYEALGGDGAMDLYPESSVTQQDASRKNSGGVPANVARIQGGPHDILPFNGSNHDEWTMDTPAYHAVSPVHPVLFSMQFAIRLEYVRIAGSDPAKYGPQIHIQPIIGIYNPYNVRLKLYRMSFYSPMVPKIYIDEILTKDGSNLLSDTVRLTRSDLLLEFVTAPDDNPTLEPGEIAYFSYNSIQDLGHRDRSFGLVRINNDPDLADGRVMDHELLQVEPGDEVAITEGQFDEGVTLTYRTSMSIDKSHAGRAVCLIVENAAGDARLRQVSFYPMVEKEWTNEDPDFGTITAQDTAEIQNGINTNSNAITIGQWLRTTREPFDQVRSLVDGNIRFLYGDGRWDKAQSKDDGGRLGIDSMTPYTGHETGSGSAANEFRKADSSVNFAGLWGGSTDSPATGSEAVVLFDVPREPLISLGQLQHAMVSRYNVDPTYAIGNSYANIRLPLDQYTGTFEYSAADSSYAITGSDAFELYDLSYLVNEALWDGYFFSTVPEAFTSQDASDLNAGLTNLPNGRLKLSVPNGITLAGIDLRDTQGGSNDDLTAFENNAAMFAVDGAFNVNSTSVDAWEAFYATMDDAKIANYDLSDAQFQDWIQQNGVAFSKFSAQLTDPGNTSNMGAYSTDDESKNFWNGYRKLTATQVRDLAIATVRQVKQRGPFLSMSEFVNRSLTDDANSRSGALQAALDDPSAGINVSNDGPAFSDRYASESSHDKDSIDNRLSGNQAAGFPGYLSQGDILQALGPVMTVRSDTFRIRAYGESLNPITGELSGSAWCEAIVQRVVEPVGAIIETLEDLDIDPDPSDNMPIRRKFIITSFRWLTEDEV